MKICAIITEYNPLHNGHIYQLQQARLNSGCDYVVCVMSGNFVQRAEPAIMDKYTRARLAVSHGADLVVELPTIFATSTADNFAYGAIRLISAIKDISHLSFGCEADDTDLLANAVDIIRSKDYIPYFRKHIDTGISYAAAMSMAVRDLSTDTIAAVLDTPNNMLGIHYMLSIRELGLDIVPLPIKRVGSNHRDNTLSGEFSSATSIRNALKGGTNITGTVPPFVYDTLVRYHMPSLNKYDAIATHALRTIALRDLQGVSEGLDNKLLSIALKHNTVEDIIIKSKSKRYTHSRLARIILSAILGINKKSLTLARNAPLYCRVLACKKESKDILSLLPKHTIIKNADFDRLTKRHSPILSIDQKACHLYTNLTGDSCGSLTTDFSVIV